MLTIAYRSFEGLPKGRSLGDISITLILFWNIWPKRNARLF